MAKKILFLTGMICLLLLGGGYVLLSLYSEEMGTALLVRLSERTGIQLSANSFSLGPFSGVRANEITAQGGYRGGEYELSVESLVFEHRLLPLVYGTLSIDRIELDRPDVLLVRSQSPSKRETIEPESRTEKSKEDTKLRIEITNVSVSEGHLLFREPDNQLEIIGLNVDLRDVAFDPYESDLVRRISGTGDIHADKVMPNSLSMRELEGGLNVAKGVLTVEDLFFVTDYGNLSSTFTLDLNEAPFHYDFEASGDPLDTNRILGTSGELGWGRLEISGEGSGVNSRELIAEGVLYLEKGKVPHHAVLEKATAVLGLTGLIGSEYATSEAPFQIRNNRIYLESFTLATAEASLSLAGWADFEGPLQLDLQVKAARAALQNSRIPGQVLTVLSDETGQVSVPLQVGGTAQNPDVRLNTELLMESAAKQGIRNILNRIPNFPE